MSITDTEAMLIGQGNQDRRYAANQIALANAELRRLRAELSKAMTALAVEQCQVAGLAGQVRAFKALHSDSPLLKVTGKTYANGMPQNASHFDFEKAYDAKAVELGIDPIKYRGIAK